MMGITPPVHLIDPQPGVEPVNALEAGAFSSGSCVESNPAFLLSWARVDAPEPFWYGNRPRWAMRGGPRGVVAPHAIERRVAAAERMWRWRRWAVQEAEFEQVNCIHNRVRDPVVVHVGCIETRGFGSHEEGMIQQEDRIREGRERAIPVHVASEEWAGS